MIKTFNSPQTKQTTFWELANHLMGVKGIVHAVIGKMQYREQQFKETHCVLQARINELTEAQLLQESMPLEPAESSEQRVQTPGCVDGTHTPGSQGTSPVGSRPRTPLGNELPSLHVPQHTHLPSNNHTSVGLPHSHSRHKRERAGKLGMKLRAVTAQARLRSMSQPREECYFARSSQLVKTNQNLEAQIVALRQQIVVQQKEREIERSEDQYIIKELQREVRNFREHRVNSFVQKWRTHNQSSTAGMAIPSQPRKQSSPLQPGMRRAMSESPAKQRHLPRQRRVARKSVNDLHVVKGGVPENISFNKLYFEGSISEHDVGFAAQQSACSKVPRHSMPAPRRQYLYEAKTQHQQPQLQDQHPADRSPWPNRQFVRWQGSSIDHEMPEQQGYILA